jgi:hypothetical protein
MKSKRRAPKWASDDGVRKGDQNTAANFGHFKKENAEGAIWKEIGAPVVSVLAWTLPEDVVISN